MALITCKECGGKMSDRAAECPHCGCPISIARGEDEAENVSSSDSLPSSSHKKVKWKAAMISVAILLLIGVGVGFCFKNEAFASNSLEITPEFTKALERYDQIDAFSEGLAAVRRDGKWGYINLKGEEVIPCQFSDDFPPGQFSEGLACVVDERSAKDSLMINKRVGFINKKGEWAIEGNFFTAIPTMSEVWSEDDHTLPSFKDGKCAVWNMAATDFWDDNNQNSKIILVDKNGKTEEAADSLGYEYSYFRRYHIVRPYKDIAQSQEKKVVHDDYAITIARDTTECDNGARLVTWQILDANNYPYQTEEKTVQYFIDNKGNSTLSSAQKESMEQHLNGLMATLSAKHNQQLLEEEKQQEEEKCRLQEEERQRQREWLYGTWEFNGTIDMGQYLGGVKRTTSKLIITEDNLIVYINGELTYNGSYEILDNEIVYDRSNGCSSVLPFDSNTRRISLGQGKYYSKISNSTGSNSYLPNSNYYSASAPSATTTFRTITNVWSYLSSHKFTGNGKTIKISERYISINGTPVTDGVRVSNIRPTSAILSASSPYLGGQQIILYLNAANGTLVSDGQTYYAN